MDALFERAARLRKVDFVEPRKTVIGKTTVAALQSGVVYGFAGQVDGIVKAIRDELGTPARVIATGGLAELMAPCGHDRARRPVPHPRRATARLGAQPLRVELSAEVARAQELA